MHADDPQASGGALLTVADYERAAQAGLDPRPLALAGAPRAAELDARLPLPAPWAAPRR